MKSNVPAPRRITGGECSDDGAAAILTDCVRLLAFTAVAAWSLGAPGRIDGPGPALAWTAVGYGVLVLLFHRFSGLPDRALPAWLDALWVLAIDHLARAPQELVPLLFLPAVFAAVRSDRRVVVGVASLMALADFGLIVLHRGDRAGAADFVLPFALLVAGPLVSWLRRVRPPAADGSAQDDGAGDGLDAEKGVEACAIRLLDRLGTRLGADVSVAALRRHEGGVRTFMGGGGEPASELPVSAAALADALFELGEATAIDLDRGDAAAGGELGASLGDLVERRFLLCAVAGDRAPGAVRVLLGRADRPFRESERLALQHELDVAASVLRQACLIEHLTAQVARMERERLSRDLHDSAIQPYIGLKFAIEALARKVSADDPLAEDVGRLLAMMQEEVDALRNRMRGMREEQGNELSLAAAARRQIERLGELFQLRVSLEADESLRVAQGVCNEVLHMISESLSNIRRHTCSPSATIGISREADWLLITVHNELADRDASGPDFKPHSLTERAAALGGYTSVRSEPGGTTVTIRLPAY